MKAGYLAHSPLTSIRQVPMGLWDGDGAPDTLLFTSDGKALLYPGNGPGGMTSGKQIASGIKGYNWVLGLGDLDGNGRSDLLVRDKAGVLWILPGTKSGFADKQFIASGFSGYDLAAAG
ncbi:MAG: VCBS repeat-containing protein [Nocardioidaceae bacterium]|nr:MAG: VCBS repeat-containing protein [Nocardioidaceae bacterium]